MASYCNTFLTCNYTAKVVGNIQANYSDERFNKCGQETGCQVFSTYIDIQ